MIEIFVTNRNFKMFKHCQKTETTLICYTDLPYNVKSAFFYYFGDILGISNNLTSKGGNSNYSYEHYLNSMFK